MKAIITLSKTFFPKHKKAGEQTFFAEKLLNGTKIHTCRANYDYWQKKITRLKEANGTLCIRQWSGKPYRSPQITILEIPASRIGIQKLNFYDGSISDVDIITPFVDGHYISLSDLAHNDGLCKQAFEDWFARYDLSKPMAIIQFTDFRY